MRINRVLDWYEKSYYKAARGGESGRSAINAIKSSSTTNSFYPKLREFALRHLIGKFYWPSTWPTSVDPPTADFLYGLVRLVKPEVAVEIGTYKGNSAIAIGQAMKDSGENNKLHTIDPIEQGLVLTAIKKSGLKKFIEYHIGFSQDVLPRLNFERIDFAFIDGDHLYESVSRDFNLVKNKILSGGVVVFHDVLVDVADGFDGPRKVVEEILKDGGWQVSIYPTEVGVNDKKEVVLKNNTNFKPVGLAVCIKK